MYCFVILLLFNKMQMSVRRFSAIPHLRAPSSPLQLLLLIFFHVSKMDRYKKGVIFCS